MKANFKINKDLTLIKSEKDPQIREDFYDELDKITLQYKKDKHFLLVLGDFNAKTGSGHSIYPENVGKCGKGHLNSNGEWLLHYAKENGLVLTNTLFQHKLAHSTTSTCAEKINPHNSTRDLSTKQKKMRGDVE